MSFGSRVAGGITGNPAVFRNIAGNHRAGSDDGVRSNRNSRKNESAGADEYTGADGDFSGLQIKGRGVELMRSGAKISLLRHRRTLMNFNLTEAIGVGAISQASSVMQNQIPRQCDARPLMDERLPVDRCLRIISTRKGANG